VAHDVAALDHLTTAAVVVAAIFLVFSPKNRGFFLEFLF
jgi:hypothetical protein